MSMMTTSCAKAVGQLGNCIKAGKGPHIFSELGPIYTKPGPASVSSRFSI